MSKRVARGALHRRYPGVYSFGPGELSPEAEAMAAVLAVGDGVLCNRPAATLLRISRFRSSVPHVLVTRRHRPVEGIVIHHCRDLDPRDVTVHRGIPMTTVPRILLDLGEDHTVWQVTNVIHEAAFRKCFDVAATRRMLARSTGRRGVALVERAIALHLAGSAGTKSALEDAFIALATDLPEPLVNTIHEGEELDFLWPDCRLNVEVDGPGHRRPAVRRDDARRDHKLKAAGYTVVRLTDIEVQRAPEAALQKVLRNWPTSIVLRGSCA
ncbi:endonuclease domain-containing protein [Solirubrobacter ginsenosidimutans]|uniref:Endonuclease domain-containing protein n=1 Tax=Solirubrobacter ginsenosidimutans TaxID=490573 RepID=A0A9X3S1V8_9ACTN|nr:DUF559 domain-containing protein [Solirubrobacter ginsenosidimutans]MDA0162854.1 endonuclease domain-containing protein [Solirubrobacter ginsenosidimutans]